MDEGIANAERCRSDVARAMHPVRIGLSVGRRTNMEMDIAGVGMLDDPTIDQAGALMRSDDRLWMDAEMQGIEVIHSIAQAFDHRGQEPAQRIRLLRAFNLCDAAIVDGESDRVAEEGGDPDIP